MLYVPIIVPTSTPPSPRSRELADLLARVIHEYETHHPSVTGAEVRDAVRLAAQSSSKGSAAAGPVLALAMGLVLFMVAGVFFFLRASDGGGGGGFEFENFRMIALVLGGTLVLGLVALFKALRRP